MRSVVLGLTMLASTLLRARGSALDEAARRLTDGQETYDRGQEITASLTPLSPTSADPRANASPFQSSDSAGEVDEEIVVPTDDAAPTPEPGQWEVACLRKSGGSLVFDRGSLRALGALTLVRWAAPEDPRTEGQIYTALVDCRGKTIEASWPGKQSDTRAGTCGRRLVDAVCEVAPGPARPSRALSPRPDGGRRGRGSQSR